MLGRVSSCAIVTLSLRRAGFPIFDFKECYDIEIQVRGHWRSLRAQCKCKENKRDTQQLEN